MPTGPAVLTLWGRTDKSSLETVAQALCTCGDQPGLRLEQNRGPRILGKR